MCPKEMLLTSELDTDAWCKVVYDRKKEKMKRNKQEGVTREENQGPEGLELRRGWYNRYDRAVEGKPMSRWVG